MHDINEQTYIPGTCSSLPDSLYLLFYKRKHPQTLGCVSDYIRKIISIIFSPHAPHISHLSFPNLVFLLVYCFTFHFTTTHNSIVSGLYNHSMCKFNRFHTLILLNRREIDKQYLHCLVFMPF